MQIHVSLVLCLHAANEQPQKLLFLHSYGHAHYKSRSIMHVTEKRERKKEVEGGGEEGKGERCTYVHVYNIQYVESIGLEIIMKAQ